MQLMQSIARARFTAAIVLSSLLAAIVLWPPIKDPARAYIGAPDIAAPELVAIAAPSSGSSVKVTIPSAVLDPNKADGNTLLRADNLTTGSTGTSVNWHSTKPVSSTVIGSLGDLIRLHASNGSDADTAEIGFVPAPSDSAPPDLDEGDITGEIDGAFFELSGPPGVILDNSFPIVVELHSPSDSATDTISGNSTQSTEALDADVLQVEADAGDRVIALFRDNVGNETELVFIADRTYSSDGAIAFHDASPSQSEAEAAGTAGVIPAGDGASAVTAYGRDFLHTVPLMNLNAPIVGLPIAIHYRSGIAYGSPLYDGPVGIGWDWALDARIEADGYDFWWYPGDGRRIGPFEAEGTVGDLRVYDSPPGVFLELTVSSSLSEGYLTALNGSRYVFGAVDGLLIRIEDSLAYTPPQTNDALNRVVLTRNDDDRVVRATLGNGTIATFGWFDCGRLASVRYQDRVVELEYGTGGNLESVVLADGSSYALVYASSSSLLAEVEESGTPAVTIVENTYATSSPSVATHRNRHNPSPADAIEFTASGSGTQVEDAVGAITVYAVNSSVPHELDYTEFRSDPDDRNSSTPYPGTALDMYAWRVDVAIHADNYLRSESKLLTSSDDDTWASPTTTDFQKWTYVTPTHSDPRLCARVGEHQLFDPASPSTPEFTESWDYGGHGSPNSWPWFHTDFDGVVTYFTYNGAGQVLTTKIDNVTTPGPTAGYDIESAYCYDDNGRITGERRPNRASGATNPWSTVYTYHAIGGGYGRLARTEQRSASNAAGPWSEFDYDSYGNVVELRRPDRVTDSDAVSLFEYDARDRQVSAIGPEVHLTHASAVSNAIRTETLTVYDDHRVSEVKQRHFTELGAAGTGTGVEHPAHTVTTYEVDDAGRVDSVLRDSRWTGSAIERSRTDTAYTVRGEVASEKTYSSATVFATTSHSYDARGMLLSTTRDPDDGGSHPAIVTWYRYDGAGRTLERFESETGSDFHGTAYDVHGRPVSSTTPWAYLTADLDSGEMGMFRTLTDHHDGTNDKWRPTGSRKQFLYAGGSWTDIAEQRFVHDEAGRRVNTRSWFRTDGSTRVYSNEVQDLFPDGSPERAYLAYEDGATGWEDFYHRNLLDGFERVNGTLTKEDGVDLISTSTVFDDTDKTGWVVRRVTGGWDELENDTGESYSTGFVHDELGRVIETREFGTGEPGSDPPIRRRFTHYGGMGQVYETVAKNNAGTESGVITRTLRDFAGRPTEERRGLSVTSGLFETRRWTYDRAGRTTAEHRVTNPGGSEQLRTTTYTYDQLDRVLETDSPEAGGSVITYAYATGTFGTLPSRLYENEAGIDIRTISNQIGHPLSETVEEWGSLGSARGASRVEYTYGSSTGCGCIASGSPAMVETLDASDDLITTVERVYDPRGAVTEETIMVDRPGVDKVELVTSMGYDAAGRRTKITYPERPDSSSGYETSVAYDYRMDGRVRSMELDEESEQTPIGVAAYLYDGSREKLRKQHAYSASSSDWIAESESLYDALGRPESKSFLLNDASGCDMGFQPSFASSIGSRTIDGQVTALTQIPRHPSESPATLSASYDGTGGLATQSIAYGAGSNPLTKTMIYTRDAFELTSVEEGWDHVDTNSQCASAPDFEYTLDYDYSNGDLAVEGVRPAGPLAFSAHNDHDRYLERSWYDHRSDRNSLGWTTGTADYYRDVKYCGCESQSAWAGFMRRDYYRIDRSFEHDAWGRVVLEGYERTWLDDDDTDSSSVAEDGEVLECETNGTYPVDVDESESEWTETWPDQESIYDGFGRLVFSIRPMAADDLTSDPTVSFSIGLYHAYSDGALIQSRGAGDDQSSEPESNASFIEYYNNPGTGQPDKVGLNRDAQNPAPSNPGNPWNNGTDPAITGMTFATPLYDMRGNLALMNGLPATGGMGCTGEAAYPETARAFDMAGGEIEPGEGAAVVAEAYAFALQIAGVIGNFMLQLEHDCGGIGPIGTWGVPQSAEELAARGLHHTEELRDSVDVKRLFKASATTKFIQVDGVLVEAQGLTKTELFVNADADWEYDVKPAAGRMSCLARLKAARGAVNGYLDAPNSWYWDSPLRGKNILEHELDHVRVHGACAKRLQAKFELKIEEWIRNREIEGQSNRSFRHAQSEAQSILYDELNALQDEYKRKCDAVNTVFERETDHSRNWDAELQWQRDIDELHPRLSGDE